MGWPDGVSWRDDVRIRRSGPSEIRYKASLPPSPRHFDARQSSDGGGAPSQKKRPCASPARPVVRRSAPALSAASVPRRQTRAKLSGIKKYGACGEWAGCTLRERGCQLHMPARESRLGVEQPVLLSRWCHCCWVALSRATCDTVMAYIVAEGMLWPT